MENIDYPFGYEVQNPVATKSIIKITGAYRRGNLTPEQNTEILSAINKGVALTARGVFLIFDLSELTYWDTLGINAVVDAIKTVNSRFGKRAGMILKKDSIAYVAARTRHAQEFSAGRIPVGESELELFSS